LIVRYYLKERYVSIAVQFQAPYKQVRKARKFIAARYGRLLGVFSMAMRWVRVAAVMLANCGQVILPAPGSGVQAGQPGQREFMLEVSSDHLVVFDQPGTWSYSAGRLVRGDRVRVREVLRSGWVAIDAPGMVLCWVEQDALEGESVPRTSGHQEGARDTAWVGASGAEIRSGNLLASMPGPPRGRLAPGVMVRLLDRPSLMMGSGSGRTRWRAIVPPEELAFYVQAKGLVPVSSGAVDRRSGHLARDDQVTVTALTGSGDEPEKVERPLPSAGSRSLAGVDPIQAADLSASLRAEIAQLDREHREMVRNRPIRSWDFEGERARWQAVLERLASDSPARKGIQARLARLDRDEASAAAAREIEAILERGKRLDREVLAAERVLSRTGPRRARGYRLVGYLKPTSQMMDGRKLFALIGSDGLTKAYLDLPPGIEYESVVTRRVGIRGESHYSRDLNAPLISVRDLEPLPLARGRQGG